MTKRTLICHHVEWDKSGKVVRREYREAGAEDRPAPPPSPAPNPAKPAVKRGARIEQDRLI